MNKTPTLRQDPSGAICFLFGDVEAGAYQLQDSHKPYLHPLNTPAGFKISLGKPHDHPHHKALMFALQTSTHNYWEEYALKEGVQVGVQRSIGKPRLGADANALVCEHTLHWMGEGEDEPQITEERCIRCAMEPSGNAFVWEWTCLLTPCRDVQLVKSPYSPAIADGTLVNYHGLGIRLRREFGCTGGNEVRVGGQTVPIQEALGMRTHSVTYRGSIDEIWPVPKCEITFSSAESYGVFVMDSPFAYLAYGPSVLETPLWKKGEQQNLKFVIRVADVPMEK